MQVEQITSRRGTDRSGVRLLVIDQSGELGGAELALLPLLDYWGSQCHTVLFASGPFAERIAAMGIDTTLLVEARINTVRKRGGTLRGMLHGVRALAAMRRQVDALTKLARQVDLVYANTQKALVLGSIAARRAGKPVVWHAHDIMSPAHFNAVQLLTVRHVVRSCVDHVIANSDASARSVHALTGIRADRIDVLSNGIAAAPFEAVPEARRSLLRRSIGVRDDVFLAGIFGRLAKWKGVHVALQAVALQPAMHLVIVGGALFGEDDYAASLRARANELKLGSRVHFVGFSDDVPGWMKAVDVVLHASIAPEPFGRVVVEGMLARRSVIATAAGGVAEIVSHRGNGMLVPPKDAFALADALSAVAASPVWAQNLGERAFRLASQRYELDTYVRAVSQILTQTVVRSPRPAAEMTPDADAVIEAAA